MLFTMPTSMSTARVNARFRQRVTAQTCHSAFGFDEGVAMHSVLSWYTMTVTDEISQLQGWHYDHICRMWQLADKTSVVGDMYQQFGDQRAWHTLSWERFTYKINFWQSHRCKDPQLQRILDVLRSSKPDASLLKIFETQEGVDTTRQANSGRNPFVIGDKS